MRIKLGKIIRNSLSITIIVFFVIAYFLFLIFFYIIPNKFLLLDSIVVFLGLTIIIIGLFLFFNLGLEKKNQIFIHSKIFSEELIKIILFISMIITFFIPPISSSKTIIVWEEIGFLNYLRAIVYLIGCAYLPGSNLYKIIFSNNIINDKLKVIKVESFFIKITLYPLLSFSFLGISTFILDVLNFNRIMIYFILFFIIIILFFIDFFIHLLKNQFPKIYTEITISRSTFIIIFFSLGIIIIAIGIMINVKYLILGDSWKAISSTKYIGNPHTSTFEKKYSYSMFWGYISYALSVLFGLPYINSNVLLTPFLYLYINSLYLLMRALLTNYRENYIVLATLLSTFYTGLFYTFSDFVFGNISVFIFDGIITFRYKSFAYFLFFTAFSLFIIISKSNNNISLIPKNYRMSEFKNIFLISFLIFQSYIIYFLTFLMFFPLIFCYCLFTSNKNENLKRLSLVFLILILMIIIFDILMNFFLSWVSASYIFMFSGYGFLSWRGVQFAFFIALIFYSILFFILISIIFFKFLIKRTFFFKIHYFLLKKLKKNENLMRNIIIFYSFVFFFLMIFGIYIILAKKGYFFTNNFQENFFYFYLNLILINIGITGIIAVFLSYFCFKKDKKLFFMMVSFILFSIIFASILIYKVLIIDNKLNFFVSIESIPVEYFTNMTYWFKRIWWYSIPAFSILSSIGLIEFYQKLKNYQIILTLRNFNLTPPIKNIIVSIFIFLSVSNLAIGAIFFASTSDNGLDDEHAQLFGWVSENIPPDSNILFDIYFSKELSQINDCNIYSLRSSIEESYKENNIDWSINSKIDENCYLNYLENYQNRPNVIKFEDNNNNGNIEFSLKFNLDQIFGSIEYDILTTEFNTFWGGISDRTIDGVNMLNGYFQYFNSSSYVKLQKFEKNIWYHIKIEFECSNNNYQGLDQYHWKAVINGTEYSNLPMLRNENTIASIDFSTKVSQSGWQIYLYDLRFSWDAQFNIKNLFVNPYPFFEKYLSEKDIKYFIHTSEETWHNSGINEYINIETLILYYFNEEIYKQGKFRIYKISF